MKLYLGNLSRSVDEQLLVELAKAYGNLVEVSVAVDRMSGPSRGFGFLEFSTNESARWAIVGPTVSKSGVRSLRSGRPGPGGSVRSADW